MIDRIDHIVLNCRHVEATASWYERALGFRRESGGLKDLRAMPAGRTAGTPFGVLIRGSWARRPTNHFL
jgi:catechol 2,3-dioxygenase-like lactoylglutathione lyase family enzyme